MMPSPAELANVFALIGILTVGYLCGRVIVFLMERF